MAAGRFEAAGWQWTASHLEGAAAWLPQQTAAFLIAVSPAADVIELANRLGSEVRERY